MSDTNTDPNSSLMAGCQQEPCSPSSGVDNAAQELSSKGQDPVRVMDGDSGFDSPAARPTPETDAATHLMAESLHHYRAVVDAEVCEKMERERDDARQVTRQWIEVWDRYGDGASLMHPRLTRALSAARKSLPEND
jgi:hypothetical protein